MIQRRGFLAGILAAGAAPAIIRPASLMPIIAPKTIWHSGGVTSAVIINSTYGKLGLMSNDVYLMECIINSHKFYFSNIAESILTNDINAGKLYSSIGEKRHKPLVHQLG